MNPMPGHPTKAEQIRLEWTKKYPIHTSCAETGGDPPMLRPMRQNPVHCAKLGAA